MRLKCNFIMVAIVVLAMTPAWIGCGGGGPTEEVPQLLELPEEERAAALAQRVCPVDGQFLGSQGTPPKVVVDRREIFVCCAECEGPLRQDPKRYLQVLDAAVTE